jgi:hypothetical protein
VWFIARKVARKVAEKSTTLASERESASLYRSSSGAGLDDDVLLLFTLVSPFAGRGFGCR